MPVGPIPYGYTYGAPPVVTLTVKLAASVGGPVTAHLIGVPGVAGFTAEICTPAPGTDATLHWHAMGL
jgi:hypothetical protein